MRETVPGTDDSASLQDAIDQLGEIVLEGLRHGFFECVVSAEVTKGKRRRLVIRSGKSHQYTIREEELREY